MERDCKKCIHHISGSCNAWECNMQTLEDYQAKVIDEFKHKLLSCNDKDELRMMIPYEYIYKVAEDMKGGAE